MEFGARRITIDNKPIKLQIWDTAGQERFRTITAAYYRGADGIVMTYDVTVRDSFTHVREWLVEVDKYASPETCKLLIGNKSDRTDRVVTEAEGGALAKELQMPFIETSARTADNVEAAFTVSARGARCHPALRTPPPPPLGRHPHLPLRRSRFPDYRPVDACARRSPEPSSEITLIPLAS